jgi:hypothetical protein
MAEPTTDYLQVGTAGSSNGDIVAVSPAGNVGIGVPQPQEKLHVKGNIWAEEGCVKANNIQCSSSREHKRDVSVLPAKELASLLDLVRSLQLVRFSYRSERVGQQAHIGIIAEDSPPMILSPDRKALSLPDFVGVLAGALQALAARSDSVSEELARLRAENEQLARSNLRLAAENENLRSRMDDLEKLVRLIRPDVGQGVLK